MTINELLDEIVAERLSPEQAARQIVEVFHLQNFSVGAAGCSAEQIDAFHLLRKAYCVLHVEPPSSQQVEPSSTLRTPYPNYYGNRDEQEADEEQGPRRHR